LPSLTPEDLVILLRNIRRVHAGDRPETVVLPDEGITAFMNHAAKTLGDAFFRTPRDTVVQFVKLLALLEQHANMDWREPLQGAVQAAASATQVSVAQAGVDERPEDDLASFKL